MHVNQGPWLKAPSVEHRVVAIDAAHPPQDSGFGPLPPHKCFIEAGQPVLGLLQGAGVPALLDGWNLQVANATGPALSVFLSQTPKLTDFSPAMVLRPDLGQAGAPARAACFVDMKFGSIEARRFELVNAMEIAGIYTYWTVETDGDPVLRFESRDGKVIKVTIPSTPAGALLANRLPGSLALHNSTTDFSDTEVDFALYFLASEGGIPNPDTIKGILPGQSVSVKQFIRAAIAKGADPGGGTLLEEIDMTTSCSNSQYP
jgi:hypothetical protein